MVNWFLGTFVVLFVFLQGCVNHTTESTRHRLSGLSSTQPKPAAADVSSIKSPMERKSALLKQLLKHPWYNEDNIPKMDSEGNLAKDWRLLPNERIFIVSSNARQKAISMLEDHSLVKLEHKKAKSMVGNFPIGAFCPEGYSYYLVRALTIMDPEKSYFFARLKGKSLSVLLEIKPEFCDKLRKLPLVIILKEPPDAVYHSGIEIVPGRCPPVPGPDER